MSSAMKKTFGTPELCAKVLVLLSATDLWAARCTSLALFNAVRGTPELEKGIFLRRDDSIVKGVAVERSRTFPVLGLTLEEEDSLLLQRYDPPANALFTSDHQLLRPNPFLFVLPPAADSVMETLALQPKLAKMLDPTTTGDIGDIGDTFISQPPIRTVFVDVAAKDYFYFIKVKIGMMLVVDGGVKVKHVVEVLQEIAASKEYRPESLKTLLEDGRCLVRLRYGYEVAKED